LENFRNAGDTHATFVALVTHMRLLSLNIKCWAPCHTSDFCRSSKVAQHFPNLGDKSRATSREWCRLIGQLLLTNRTAAVFTMETVWSVDEGRCWTK